MEEQYKHPEDLQLAPADEPTEPTTPVKPVRRPRSWLRSLAQMATIWLVAFLTIRFIIPSYDVQGSSMEPTYPVSGERVLTDQVFFKLFGGGPQRGDVVVVSTEGLNLSEPFLIKRVVGLPGEKLEIRNGVVYINNQALTENYVQNKASYNYPATQLSSNCYFVLGDNRPVSLDSHYFGCVSKDNITAKVLFNYPWHL
jgi:signal peptidase I